MNRKISLGLCISLVIVAIAATFSITMVYSKQIYNKILSNISQRSGSYDSAEEINRIISNYFYGDLDEFNNNLGASVAEGYVNGLNDANSYYMTASEYAAYTEEIETGTYGVGVEAMYDYTDDCLVITYVYSGSSAESEGIKKGDAVVSVNGETVTRSNYKTLQALLFGKRTDSVQIEIKRDDETKTVQPISSFLIPSVTGSESGTVGYIRISKFGKNTADEIDEMLTNMQADGIESIVFDVRNTDVGTTEYAAKAIDVIVPNIDGKIAVAKDKNGDDLEVFSAERSNHDEYSYAVLINSGTSGPAELFAADMRDIMQAQLVGSTTAGVGTMQKIYTLDDGSAILLTVALIIPKNGESAVYNKTGISPTYDVKSSVEDSKIMLLTESEDTQLQKAVSLLNQ